MKGCLVLIVGLIIFGAAPAFANLGDSEEQAAERYGQPTKSGVQNKNGITNNVYKKGDYLVLIQFLKRRSLAESYTREDQRDFSEKELSAFLEANSNGQAWQKDPEGLAWERSDHKATAWCQTLSGRPTFLIEAK